MISSSLNKYKSSSFSTSSFGLKKATLLGKGRGYHQCIRGGYQSKKMGNQRKDKPNTKQGIMRSVLRGKGKGRPSQQWGVMSWHPPPREQIGRLDSEPPLAGLSGARDRIHSSVLSRTTSSMAQLFQAHYS